MKKRKRRNILNVDLFREIKNSFERFLSIFAIVCIGVAFFAGIKASSSVMKASADAYFDKYNLMDFRILSNFGLVEDDVAAIKSIEGVSGVYATNTITVTTAKDTEEYVMIVHGIDIDDIDSDDPNYINQYDLIEGRFPEKSGECLIEDGKIYQSNLQIGDTITLDTGTDEDILDELKTATYTIVGIVRTPYYLSYEKGSTNIKDGRIDSFLIIPNSDFTLDYYSEVFVTVDGAKAYNSYTDAYFDYIEDVEDRLASIGITQSEKRYDEIIAEATDKLNEAQQEYDDAVTEYNDQIEAAETAIEEGRFKLIEGQIELSNNKLMLQIQLEAYQTEIETANEGLAASQSAYDDLYAQYIDGRDQVNDLIDGYQTELDQVNSDITDTQAAIDDLQGQINANQAEIADLQAQQAALDPSDPQYTILQGQIDALESANTDLQTQLDADNAELTTLNNRADELESNISLARFGLDTMAQQLETLQTTITSYQQQINELNNQITTTKASAETQFAAAEQQLDEGEQELIDAQLELARQKEAGQEQLEDASEAITKAQKDIDSIDDAQWYILDRESHYSYVDYGSAADRMDNIAKVFPVFFFLVAALVCSTTMTRMIDEQRGTIGTFKALGYSNRAIISKYLKYSLIASAAGCIIGIIAGMYIFPTVIFEVWNTMYTIPQIVYLPNIQLAVLTSVIAVAVTALASFSSCYIILKENPASLLRPKAPVIGKKIMLERISFIWKKMSFTAKVTARNIFRYKKRFFMTVIGISGCSALLLAGFGIRDSIGQIVVYQFEEIMQYSASATFDDSLTTTQKEDFLSDLLTQDNVSDAMLISQSNGTIYVGNDDLSVSIIVPYDVEEFKDFYSLRVRSTREAINIKSTGVVITEKAANDLGLSIGDKITIANEDGYKEQAEITGISENYVGHYIFMSPAYYKELFDLRPDYNTTIIKLADTSDQAETDFGSAMIDTGDISSITFYSGLADQFMDMISSLNLVVIVMIVSAGMLAFVVLYNLSNVNISERMREIATIKVLGFNDREVSNYVYREIAILTVIGALFGLLLGKALHLFIMKIAELDTVMFGREIYPISYVYAVLITFGFSLIVNIVMSRKLRRIKMVESLKSVE